MTSPAAHINPQPKLVDLLHEQYEYYRIDKNNPIPVKEVLDRWSKNIDKAYDGDDGVHAYYSIDELRLIRSGNELRDLPGSDYYDKLKKFILENIANHGYALADGMPIVVMLGRNGKMKVGEGNHRIHICKSMADKIESLLITHRSPKQQADIMMVKSALDKLPVRFIYYQEV